MAESALRRIIENPLETPAQRAAQALPTPANRNFVRRYLNPDAFPVIRNPDGSVSTHRMSSAEVDGSYVAYPTIVQNDVGRLEQLGDDAAFDYAMRNNEYLSFPSEAAAQQYAEGGYKQQSPAGSSLRRNMQQERMDARRARIGMEPYVPQAPTKTAGQAMSDMLGGISIPLGFVPGIGDATGLAADAAMYANYPEERTLGNAALTLAGLLPLVPAASAIRAGKNAAEGALDMSQEARMQRAKEQGYVDRVYYHGTGSDFDAFDLGQSGGARHNTGVFVTDNPSVASTYAVGANRQVMPLRVAPANPVEVYAEGKNWNRLGPDTVVKLPERYVIPEEDMLLYDLLGGEIPKKFLQKPKKTTMRKLFPDVYGYENDFMDTNDFARWAKRQGVDSVIFNDIVDRGPSGMFSSEASIAPSQNIVFFDPTKIRSTNAAFDPAKRNSANIMAGMAGAALGVSALRPLVPPQEQE